MGFNDKQPIFEITLNSTDFLIAKVIRFLKNKIVLPSLGWKTQVTPLNKFEYETLLDFQCSTSAQSNRA